MSKINLDLFKKQINKQKDKVIGLVLVNQRVISGIGNYLRAEALWLAKISPFRKVKNLDDKMIKSLYDSLKMLISGKNKLKDRYFYVYLQDYDIYNNKVTKEKLYEGSQIRHIHWVKKRQK